MAWYVVYRGKVHGVYATWARCNAQVTGFKNNSYKSFPNKEEAEASYFEFMGCEDDKVFVKPPPKVVRNTPVLFVVAVVQSFFCWCSCGSFLLVATTACDAQNVLCKLVMTMTL